MSYIDTFDHEFLGYFGHIPLYRPLVEVPGTLDEFDFGCKPEHIILGGGSGEHPAVIFSDPEYSVAQFMVSWMQQSGVEDDERWDPWIDALVSRPYKDCVHFAGWSADDYHAFGTLCRSAAMYQPFSRESGALETWLASNIGELIFFSMKDLFPKLDECLPGAPDVVQPVYGNIVIPPPGYPSFGRIVVDGEIRWGNSRWHRN